MINNSRQTSCLKKVLNTNSLEQQIEYYTQLLENEKRLSNSLDLKLASLQNTSKLQSNATALKVEITTLEKQLSLYINNLNKSILENSLIRQQIDVLRKEKLAQKKNVFKFNKELSRNSSKVKRVNSLSKDFSALNQQSDSKLNRLRVQSEDMRQKFMQKASALSLNIQNSKLKQSEFLKQLDVRLEANALMSVDPIQTLKILKANEAAWKAKCIEKKKEFEAYYKHIKELKQNFTEIFNATGNLNINELTTTIIKSENQQQDIKVLYNELFFQIEKFQKENDNIDSELTLANKSQSSTASQISGRLKVLQMNEIKFQEKIKHCSDRILRIRDCLNSSSVILAKSIELISGARPKVHKYSFKIMPEYLSKFEDSFELIQIALNSLHIKKSPLVNSIETHLKRSKSAKPKNPLRLSQLQMIETFECDDSLSLLKAPLSPTQFKTRATDAISDSKSISPHKKSSPSISFNI